MSGATPSRSDLLRHSILEDGIGLFCGVVLVSLAMMLFAAGGLVTGQTAGVALLLSHATGWDLGLVFFAINLPFYAFALMRMGWVFTLRTFGAVLALSALTSVGPRLIPFGAPDPIAAAIAASALAGVGLVVLFRHRSSLGGVGILGLYLQDRVGFRAGWLQMIVDAAIFVSALFVLEFRLVLISALGAAVLNIAVALNHRTDRYIAR
ncbi:MAG: YitT family protein [Neomegalonema sp.]|nr:YitT family protein [Neomegalonema sp.]